MRFLVFMGHDYYPSGGWNDFIKDFESVESAQEFVVAEMARQPEVSSPSTNCRKHQTPIMSMKHKWSWAQIVDLQTSDVLELHPQTGYCPTCDVKAPYPLWEKFWELHT